MENRTSLSSTLIFEPYTFILEIPLIDDRELSLSALATSCISIRSQ